jgi:hemoglobin
MTGASPASVRDLHDLTTRDDVEQLVRDFYRQAAMDELLGPIFEAAHVDWPSHIDRLTDFWSWQLFGERGYEGHPLRAHEPAHDRTPFSTAHYQRWVELFCEAVDTGFDGPVAETAKTRGRKMAAALERLLAGGSGPGDAPITPIVTLG